MERPRLKLLFFLIVFSCSTADLGLFRSVLLFVLCWLFAGSRFLLRTGFCGHYVVGCDFLDLPS